MRPELVVPVINIVVLMVGFIASVIVLALAVDYHVENKFAVDEDKLK